MDESKRKSIASLGQISVPDRVQRLGISVFLMTLTIWGLTERMDWKPLVALVLQVELLLTGLAGWCPVYCAYRAMRE